MLLLGHLLNFIIHYSINRGEIKDFKIFLAQFIIFILFSSALIIAERMALRYLRTAFLKNLYLKNHLKDSIPRALVYGGGLRCRFFLTERFNSIEENPIDIIGIIDDQPAIRGQYVYGFKVIGNINDLEELYKKNPFNRFIISSREIDSQKRERAKEFCKKYDIKLTELIFQENLL
jgi:FlaA1/EpsC-like NDP-sugar epimerase